MTGLGETRIARRYAGALFAAARHLDRLEAVGRDLGMLMEVWRGSQALRQLLESPLIPAESKLAMLDRAIEGADPLTTAFLHLLVHKRRAYALPVIREEYRQRSDDAGGIARAVATVAAPLGDAERSDLVSALEERCGRRVELEVKVEPALLGGIMVRIGDTVLDGSVRGALERIREHMLL